MNPGDVMFFPSFWWHGVQNIGPLTVGVDIPLVDVFGSWQRNAYFTAATFGNPNLVSALAKALWTGLDFRTVFFDGYLLDGTVSKEIKG